VTHRLLRNRLATRTSARRVVRRIGRSLRACLTRPDGRRAPPSGGVPQGGPLAPVRAQVLRDDPDQAWARRGRRFARYADDWLLFVRPQRAAERVRRRIRRFIEGPLRRRVHPSQSHAARLRAGAALGFELRRAKSHRSDAAVQRFTERARASTPRSTGRKMTARSDALKRYGAGGLHDVGHSQR
jgi:RNA-directed DNA polymerase